MNKVVYAVYAVPEAGVEVVCHNLADAEEILIDLANEDAYEAFFERIHAPGYGWTDWSIEDALRWAEWVFDEWEIKEIPLI